MSYDTAPGISIHAAREGGDAFKQTVPVSVYLSIHAAREGGDVYGSVEIDYVIGFQSTPPVKAATRPYIKPRHPRFFQSTPPVKAATTDSANVPTRPLFQSTPPVKAATLPEIPLFLNRDTFNPRRP